MSVLVTSGEVIHCQKCNRISVRVHRYGNWSPLIPWVLLIPWYKEYYLHNDGICQKCIKRNKYKILSKAEYRLIKEYQKQIKTLSRIINSSVERAVYHFSQSVSKEFLKELNPTAIVHYQNDTDYDPLSMKYLPASRYIDEIKPDIIAWIIQDAHKCMLDSQKYNYSKVQLMETEKKVKELLARTEGYTEYCKPEPVDMKKCSFTQIKERRPRLKEMLVRGKFYKIIENGKNYLKELVEDSAKYEIVINEEMVTKQNRFHQLLDRLPVWITENHFWK